MERMAYVWSYQQSIEELKNSLLCTTLELESTQMAIKEEKRRNEENIKQLFQLLKTAFQERDEAKNQLQMLLNSIGQPKSMEPPHFVPSLLQESQPPPLMITKGSSSLTDSVSSPVDSVFDAVSSAKLPNMDMIDSTNVLLPFQPFIHPQENNPSPSNIISPPEIPPHVDHASAVIGQMSMRKPLPEKGKMLTAVMESGPLLQTLLIAGPLPQWRNPPPMKSLQIPPISITRHDSPNFVPNSALTSTCPNLNSSASYCPMPSISLPICSAPSLNFPNMKKRPAACYDVGNDIANYPVLKRQKFQC